MNIRYFIFAWLALAGLLLACTEDEPAATHQSVQFSISPHAQAAAGRVAATLPDDASVLVTITKPNGTPVLTQHRIAILRLGNSYITDALPLNPGDYILTDFWVVRDTSEVLYLTPQAGSPLGDLVSRPVPLSFTVAKNAVADIAVDVVDATGTMPDHFGYASFVIGVNEVVPWPRFRVAVFALDGKPVLTEATAWLSVIGSEAPAEEYVLTAKINTLDFEGDSTQRYTLTIIKPGYAAYAGEFTYRQLVTDYGIRPLEVILEKPVIEGPAFTFVVSPEASADNLLQLTFSAPGTLYIDWGDDYIQKVSFTAGTVDLRHAYQVDGDKPVRVTGNLDRVEEVDIRYYLTNLDIISLTELKDLTLIGPTAPGTISFEGNRALETVRLENGTGDICCMDSPYTNDVRVKNWTPSSGYAQFTITIITLVPNYGAIGTYTIDYDPKLLTLDDRQMFREMARAGWHVVLNGNVITP